MSPRAQLPHSVWEQVDLLVDRNIDARCLHVWPFEGSFPADVRFLLLNRSHDVPFHRPDHLEVVYIESGEIGYQVHDRELLLRPGDLVVVGDGIFHRCLRKPNPEVRSVVLSFQPGVFHGRSGDYMEYLTPFFVHDPTFPNVISASSGISSEILDLMLRVRNELPANSDYKRLAAKTYLQMILLLLVGYYQKYSESRDALRRRDEWLKRLRPLLDHLENHSEEPLRVRDAARLSAMSTCYFMHHFRRATGQSFVDYLNHLRVTKARKLLAESDTSISEISQGTGFCNQSYFGVVFKRIVGTTPFEYRKQFRTSQG